MKSLALALALTACTADTFTGADGSLEDGGSGDAIAEGGSGDASGCAPGGFTCPANGSCNAFDDASPTLAPFTNFSTNGGGQSFETDQAVTCPRGLVAMVPQAAAGSPVRGGIGLTNNLLTPSLTAHARVELDILLPKSPTGPSFFVYLYAGSDFSQGIGFEFQNGSWLLKNHVTNDEVTLQPPPRTGTWNHVALDVIFSTSGNVARSEVDYLDPTGTKQVAPLQGKATLPGGTATVSQITFVAGVGTTGLTSGPMTVYLDDVAFSPF